MKASSISKAISAAKQPLFVLLLMGIFITAKADYTIPNGTTLTVNSPLLSGQTGTLYIFGILDVNASASLNFTTIILFGPSGSYGNGQIYWSANKSLTLLSGCSLAINNGAKGLYPVDDNAAERLYIGSVLFASGNGGGQGTLYTFAQVNAAGGSQKVNPTASNYSPCTSNNITIYANSTGLGTDIISWSISPSGPLFSSNNSSSSTSTTLSKLSANSYTVTCQLKNSAGSTIYDTKTITINASASATWLGVNTDWNSTSNWCNGTLPTSSTDVTIGTGLSNYPVISTTGLVKNLTIATGGTALLTVTGSLSIAGTISSTNAINASTGTIEMNGSISQIISASNFASDTIANLLVNNSFASATASNPSVAIASAVGMLKISNTLSFGNKNNMVLNTNDNITLLSTATATARVADITNNDVNTGNSIAGKFVIERYIPAKRSWRLLTAPVTSASLVKISDSWQEAATRVTNPSAAITSATNPNSGYGTQITYGNPATNGYDQGINGNTNIKYLTSSGWNGVPTATNNGITTNSGYITDQLGYFLFVRGDRSTQLSLGTSAAPTTTTLRMKGVINTGTVTIGLGAKYAYGISNFRIIGNPFASAINFHKVALNSYNASGFFADAFYIWDPYIGSNSVGGWVALSYNNSTGKYNRTVIPNGYSSTIDNSGDIQSGSAIMIDYNGAATTFQIKESNKVAGSNNTQFRPAGSEVVRQIRTSLLEKYPDGNYHVNDGALISFDENYSNAVDEKDMKKLPNFSENFSILKEGKTIAIESRKPIAGNDTIFYSTTQLSRKNYELEFAPDGLVTPVGTAAFLEDTYLKTTTPIHLIDTTTYPFDVTDNASASSQRFRLVFKPSLQFVFANVNAMNEDALIAWEIKEELNINHFEIERSIDGNIFTSTGILESKGNSINPVNYSFTDPKPATGNYYYRIKGISNDSIITYSNSMFVKIVNNKPGMYIFPNPISNSVIGLRMNAMKAGIYAIKLYNLSGNQIYASIIQSSGGSFSKSIELKTLLADGNYYLMVTDPDKKITKLACTVLNK